MTGGKNQHHIPSFVQRPFAIPRPEQSQTRGYLAFRPWCSARATPDQGHWFRGPLLLRAITGRGSPTLDDAITAREPHLSLALRNVRDMPPGNSVEADSAAEIVFHLATRTAHVRSSLGEGADLLLDGASRVFTDADNIAALVGLDAGEPTDLFREGVVNELATNPVIAGWNLPPRLLERLAFMALQENSHLLDENANFMAVLLSELRTGLPVAVRDGHNLALGQRGLPDDSYEALLRTLKWGVVNAPIAGAILPDCIVVAIGADGNADTHLFAGRDGLHVIVMPVSPDKLLVGRRSGIRDARRVRLQRGGRAPEPQLLSGPVQ